MFDNLNYDQLLELRTALWNHYDASYAAYSEELQTLDAGSAEMDKAITNWNTLRDNIKAMQKDVVDEILTRTASVCPRPLRRRNAADCTE